MRSPWTPYAAHALTAVRIVLTPVFVASASAAPAQPLWGVVAVLAFAAVAVSDVWDGRVARHFASSSHAGLLFDLFADIAFLLPALGTYVYLDLMPWWVPASVSAAFFFFVIDSGLLWGPPAAPGPPEPSPARAVDWFVSHIGHIGGVSNFILVGVLVCNNSAGIQLLSPTFLSALYLLVPLYSAAAVAARLAARRQARVSQAGVPTAG